MNLNVPDYRTLLIGVFQDIDYTIADFYNLGFNIGLEEEWKDWKATLKDGDTIPIDLEYLKIIKHPSVAHIMDIIQILVDVRDQLININNLTPEEISEDFGAEESDEPSENAVEAPEVAPGTNYLHHYAVEIFNDLISIYEFLWMMAYNSRPTDEIYDMFGTKYFDGDLELESNDLNVVMILDALNKVMRINALIEY